MTAWIIAIGRMLGLGSIAGIRPSLTLAVIGVVGYFDWGIDPNPTFNWLSYWWVIGIFVVLAILESTFDKISKLDRLQDRLIMPYRLVDGRSRRRGHGRRSAGRASSSAPRSASARLGSRSTPST